VLRAKGGRVMAFVVLLAACAGDDGASELPADAASQDSAAAAAGEAPAVTYAVTATLSDDALTLSQDSVATGAVTILVRNSGTQAHVLRVNGEGEAWETDALQPGTDITMSLNLNVGRFMLTLADSSGATPASGPMTVLRVY